MASSPLVFTREKREDASHQWQSQGSHESDSMTGDSLLNYPQCAPVFSLSTCRASMHSSSQCNNIHTVVTVCAKERATKEKEKRVSGKVVIRLIRFHCLSSGIVNPCTRRQVISQWTLGTLILHTTVNKTLECKEKEEEQDEASTVTDTKVTGAPRESIASFIYACLLRLYCMRTISASK